MNIFHGLVNICGAPGYLADWQRKKGLLSDFFTYEDLSTYQNHDYSFQISKLSRFKRIRLKISFFIYAIKRYDLFHFHFGSTFLPFSIDLPILKLFRKKIIMSYYGSEVRLIKLQKKVNPYYYLLKISDDDPKFDKRKIIMMKWHSLWVDKFIAARNLISSLKVCIPKRKIVELWAGNIFAKNQPQIKLSSIRTNKIPIIVHAPSELEIKGTKFIREAVKDLKKKRIKFIYKEISKVPHNEALEIYRDADIIIDQMLLGTLGTLGFEVMHIGKPLVSFVIDKDWEGDLPELPIWNVNIDNLTEKLEILIKDPDLRISIAKKSYLYVEKVFNFEIIQNQLIVLYKSL